jgi:hypothetical protein
MDSKKILITANFFYPEITPRAFRVHELVKEFCRCGHKVTLVIPNKEIYHINPVNINGLKIEYGQSDLKETISSKKRKLNNNNLKARFLKIIKKIGRYFFPREIFMTYDKGLTKTLITLRDNYDFFISISQPLSIHLSVLIGGVKNKHIRKCKRIAEFSDPLFRGNKLSVFPLNYLWGFLFSLFFNKFTIPTKNSLKHFSIFKRKHNIQIIPQGFDLSSVDLSEYIKNNRPTFAYAGTFYKNLRDPSYFFEYILSVKKDFLFILYVPDNLVVNAMVNKYKDKISDKIDIRKIVQREELIYELSKIDFLINFNNENSQMVPSKLIDYALTSRPIISFNSKTFDCEKFNEFLNGNYKHRLKVTLNNYDIKKIANKFLI